MRKGFLIILALMALALAGCGSGSSSSSETTTAKPYRIPIPGGGLAPIRYQEKMHLNAQGLSGPEPKPVIPQQAPPNFLVFTDLKEGIGNLAETGTKMTIQYVGYDYETGKKFVSSWDQGEPFTFTLGKGEVIPGWEEGLRELEGGDRRELVVPPDMTEGPYPPNVPKGKTVVFVVDYLPDSAAKKSGGASGGKPAQKGKSPQESQAKKTKPKVEVPSGPPPKKLETKDLEEGSGPVAKAGDKVSVNYVGVDYKSGKEFDASWDRGEPFTFTLGAGEVIPGWDQGVEGMKVGGRRELIIPPELGYGAAGAPPSIPPNETLVFVVDLEAIE